MKTKRILLITMAALTVASAHGQDRLNEMLHKIESQHVKYPPKRNSIEVNSETEKDKGGNIIMSRKLFVIRDWPNLVAELESAFDQEKEHAAFVRESVDANGNNRKIVKRYFFRVGDNGGLVYQMFGTTQSMTFTYAYSVEANKVIRKSYPEIRFNGVNIIKNGNSRIQTGIIGDGEREDIREMTLKSDGGFVTITADGVQGKASSVRIIDGGKRRSTVTMASDSLFTIINNGVRSKNSSDTLTLIRGNGVSGLVRITDGAKRKSTVQVIDAN